MLIEELEWRKRANCKDQGPAMFFPERGVDVRAAIEICNGCEVKAECLILGLTQEHGIWGGLSARQRRILVRASKSLVNYS